MCKWNAADLLRRMDGGEFDRNLPEFLKSLTPEELADLCELMAQRQEDRETGKQAAAKISS